MRPACWWAGTSTWDSTWRCRPPDVGPRSSGSAPAPPWKTRGSSPSWCSRGRGAGQPGRHLLRARHRHRPRPAHIVVAAPHLLSWAFIPRSRAAHATSSTKRRHRRWPGISGRRDGARLLGLRVLLVRHRHDVAGVGRGRHAQGDPRTVAAHGVVSFIFNAALLALTVNIAERDLAPGRSLDTSPTRL